MRSPLLFVCLFCLLVPFDVGADELVNRGITYATVGDRELKLDLYLPEDADSPSLVVWVHGGAWIKGHRYPCPIRYLNDEGFAVASVSYRFAQDAVFPAQLHDCKAAVRFLRANAEEYGYNAERIGAAGASAGGHLVSLLGTTSNDNKSHGKVGEHHDVSSAVDAVYNLFGPTDLINLDDDSDQAKGRPNPISMLLGADPDDEPELAKAADPATYVDENDPPVLIVHGTNDQLVPLSQSEYLAKKLKASDVDHRLVVLKGAGHGGRAFRTKERRDEVIAFFTKHLIGEP
ncbi:MAG: alpha/beta fold hydrolase [Phycisphaeraceae bacterium]